MYRRGGVWGAAVALLALIGGMSAARLPAQAIKASISGRVLDTSGAAVVGATITVKNAGTGITRTITSDDQGRFNVLDIDIGTYELDAEAAGFKKYVHTGLELTVGQQLVEDINLEVGASVQAVTVEGESAQVETSSASVGVLVEPTQMQDIPLNGRNYTDLLTLAPGVVNSNFSKSSLGGNGNSYSVSGSRAADQAFLLDNTNSTDYNGHGVGGSAVSGESMGVDAIAEFQMLTNTYSAQYGGFGAVLAAVTKSGTNNFHGTAYEYIRNSVLDARNVFDPPSIPKYRRNQFGGSIGGPIKKDKLFFFTNYEGLRSYWGISTTVQTPDAESRLGVLPDCVIKNNAAGCVKGQLDPLPATANNAAGQVAPVIAATVGVYPLPATATEVLSTKVPGDNTGIAQYIDVGAQVIHENYWITRIDYTLSQKDSLFARYMLDESNLLQPSAPDLWPIYATNGSHIFTVEEKHIPNQNWVNLARFSFVRAFQNNSFLNQLTFPSMLWYPVGPNQPQDGAITVTGLTGIGPATSGPKWFAPNHFIYADDVLWNHGAHTVNFGMALERIQENVNSPFNEDGTYAFTSLESFLQASVSGFTGVGVGQANALRYARELLYTPYFQDQWRVSSKLTLNLGLRYDGAANPTEAHGNFYNLLIAPAGNGLSSYVQVPHAFLSNPAKYNFAPRVGLAYSPFSDHKTSIRAGFGIFHDVITASKYLTSYALQPPFVNLSASTTSYPGGVIPYGSCSSPTCPNGPASVIIAHAPAGINSTTHLADYLDNVTPYMMQYNLNIQRELPGNTILSVGYVGSRTVHLFTAYDINPPTLTPTGPGGALAEATLNASGKITSNPRINTNFGNLDEYPPDGWSRYDSLQVSVNRRLTHNLQGQVSYTWSRCFDLTDMSTGLEGTNSGVGAEDIYAYHIAKNWGPCDVDRRNSLVASSVYNLPFHGNRLVEGWQLSGLWTWTSGTPFSVDNGFDNVGSGVATPGLFNDRVNWGTPSSACPNPLQPLVKQGAQWYNPNCFTVPAVGIQGDMGKNVLTGPHLFKVDFALTKMTMLTERVNMQFRAEAFNAFNNSNMELVTANLNNFTAQASGSPLGNVVSTSGTMNTTATISRQIQFGVRFIF